MNISEKDFKNGVGLADGDVVNVVSENGGKEQQTYFSLAIQAITKITLGSFRSRLKLAEKVAIVEAAKLDSETLVIEADLNNSSHIDLDSLDLQWGMSLLVQKGLITQERLSIILKDGESHEAF